MSTTAYRRPSAGTLEPVENILRSSAVEVSIPLGRGPSGRATLGSGKDTVFEQRQCPFGVALIALGIGRPARRALVRRVRIDPAREPGRLTSAPLRDLVTDNS
jgi:hypothetical protein